MASKVPRHVCAEENNNPTTAAAAGNKACNHQLRRGCDGPERLPAGLA